MENNYFCRLCCKNEANLFLFFTYPNDIQLSAKIMYFTNITVEDGDGLPSFICKNCEMQVNACYHFVIQCEQSDKRLRSQSLAIISEVTEKFEDYVCAAKLKLEIKSDEECHENTYSDDIPLQDLKNAADVKVEDSKIAKRKPYKVRAKVRKKQLIKCTVCGQQCSYLSTLETHMRSHTNEYLFPCSMCDKKYKDRSNLKRHVDRNHTELRKRNYICETCGKAFYSKSDVKVHLRTHTGETPYGCTECSAKFTQLCALHRHKKRHTGEKNHLCSICPKRFCTKTELKLHHAVHSAEKQYSCSLCNTTFKYKSNLTKHRRLHDELFCFICDYCGQSFKFKGNLKIHLCRQHSEKSGYCEVCCRHVANLHTHMWRHTGERPLKCELCTHTFFDPKALARHINIKHTKTDRHKCDVEGCSMTFPMRHMLDFHHAKLHSTHIPFPCDRCTRAFYRKNDLARHKIGTHKEKLI